MTPAQREAMDAMAEHGSQRAAAQALGISRRALRERLHFAQKWLDAPEGQKAATEAAGLDIGTARHGWRVIPREDGGRDSVFWKAEDAAPDPPEPVDRYLDGHVPSAPAGSGETSPRPGSGDPRLTSRVRGLQTTMR